MGKWVELSVIDTGEGIGARHLPRGARRSLGAASAGACQGPAFTARIPAAGSPGPTTSQNLDLA